MKFAEIKPKTYPNSMGFKGWVYGGRYGFERYMYILQRITGLGILFYLPLHILVTGQKMDQATWEMLMTRLTSWPMPIGEFLVFAAGIFHALNGIRLLFTHFGFLMAKPARPVYPFTIAALRQRWTVYLVFLMSTVIVCFGAYEFFLIVKH